MMGLEYDGVQLNTGVSRALDQYEWRTPLRRESTAAVKPFWLADALSCRHPLISLTI
jgi:hypothetical protein